MVSQVKNINRFKGTFKMKNTLLLAASCAAISFASAPANAQSIDYGTMEEMFGEPVTTSATGKPQRMSDVPVTMEIVTQDDIRRSGAVNLPEALRQVNGVNVVQRSELQYDVSIRGYNKTFSNRLLVLVNGRAVYLDHFGVVNWASIPVQLEEIRQIEVVKGPNTALFGFNAVSGVINIVTYNPLYDDESSATVTVGTQDYKKGSIVHTFKPTDKLGVRISAGMSQSNSFDNSANLSDPITFTDGVPVANDPENKMINLDTMLQLTDKSQLRLEFSASDSEQAMLVPGGGLFREKYENKSGKISYEVDSDWGLIKANLYKNFLKVYPQNNAVASTVAPSLMDNDVLVAQLENTIQLNPQHTVRVGGEFRQNSMTSTGFMPAGSEISYEVYAVNGMWNWMINDQLSWTNAARVDYLDMERTGPLSAGNTFTNDDYDKDITEFSYNSGLVWKATDHDTLRLSTSRGLEVPTLLEFGIALNAGPVTLIGDPDIKTTIATNYELAWDRKVDAIDGMFRSALFYQTNEDIKNLSTQVVGANVIAGNLGDSETYGIELGLDGKFNENVDWGVGYIFQVINDDLVNGKSNNTLSVASEFEDGNPQHQVNASLGYQKGPWELDSMLYYVSETDQIASNSVGATVLEEIDGYVGANARIAYTFEGDTTLALHGQQLLRSQTQTSVTPDVERRVYLSLSKKF